MTSINCEYCLKNYCNKSSLKKHFLICKAKKKHDEIEIIKNNSGKTFNETTIINYNCIIDKLPDDIIRLTMSFLHYDNKYKYCSYRRVYNEYLNITYVSKRMYNLFNPSFEKIIEFKDNLEKERETRICKSTAKSTYNLKDYELDDLIEHYLVKNPHYSCARPMKIYQIADILDYLYVTCKTNVKLPKDKKEFIQNNRIINFQKLMEPYGFTQNNTIYNNYYNDYIHKGQPSLKEIKSIIDYYIEQERRKTEITTWLNENDLNIFINHNIITNYINSIDNKSLQKVIDQISGINNRTNEIKQLFVEKNMSFNSKKDIIDNYIEHNIGNALNIFECITGRENRKKAIEVASKEKNIIIAGDNVKEYIEYNKGTLNNIVEYYVRKEEIKGIFNQNHYSKLCNKYINTGKPSLEYIVETLTEINFYIKYTNYKQIFINIRMNNNDYNDISNTVKHKALINWCKRFKSYEEAISNDKNKVPIPVSLYNKIYDIFNTTTDTDIDIDIDANTVLKFICKCENMASFICGFCNKCCQLKSCIKH